MSLTPGRSSPHRWTVFAALLLLAVASIAVCLLIGSVKLQPAQAWQALTHAEPGLARTLIWELRLPRALTAFAIGGLLALAGALMQVLLRNPLADPYVMGISGGAAITALTALLLGCSGFAVDASATAGALGATLLVFALARGEGGWSSTRLLLTGVVVAAGAGAIISVLLSLGEDARLRSMLFWLMGDLSLGARPGPLLLLLAGAVVISLLFARHLNILARGEAQARMLGIAVPSMRIGLFCGSSLLTAAAVTAAGSIGFVGLVTPHLMRLLLGPDHRNLLPASVLMGGTLLTLADLLSRTLIAPRQLPVGALTAMIGVPLFLVLMRRHRSMY